MSETAIAIVAVANIPVYIFLGWIIFRDWEGFWEAIKFWLKPDLWSLFDGTFFEDWWEETKLGFWAVGCAAVVFLEIMAWTKFTG